MTDNSPPNSGADAADATVTPRPASPRRLAVVIAFLLFGLALAPYVQTWRFDFLNYDDNQFVYGNETVAKGLTFEGVRWAWKIHGPSQYHPLTWLSHMLDCQLFGLNPAGHHIVNALLHALNAVLLFALLRALTGAVWRSAVVAALFAVHPLRVESVAWVSERKDVLSGALALLTLWAYARYAQVGGGRRYAWVVLWYALGLLAKPMLVTLPLVMLVLDHWPLRRRARHGEPAPSPDPESPAQSIGAAAHAGHAAPRSLRFLIAEKLPLLALAAVSSWLTVLCQRDADAFIALERFPMALRLGNALVSWAWYLGATAFPMNQAVIYPYPTALPWWQPALGAAALVLSGGVAWAWRRRAPYLAFAWLWMTISLLPVIGILQVGQQARADRYSYLPMIGPVVALVWGLGALTPRLRAPRWAWACLVAPVVVALMWAARGYATHFRDSNALWLRALAVTQRNAIAHSNYANVLVERNRFDAAIDEFRRAIEINPLHEIAHNNLGNVLLEKKQRDLAAEHYWKSVQANPRFPLPYYNLARMMVDDDQLPAALRLLDKTLSIVPRWVEAHVLRGAVLFDMGRPEQAAAAFRQALEINPNIPKAHLQLADTLLKLGDAQTASFHYGEAKRLSKLAKDERDAARAAARKRAAENP